MKFWKSNNSKSKRETSERAKGVGILGGQSLDASQHYSEINDAFFVYKGQSKKHYPKDFTHVTIHSSIRKIGKNAFQNCRSLYSIAIPPKVKSIRESAFEECPSLVLVEFYEGLEHIEYAAFRSCQSLLGMHDPDYLITSLMIPSTVQSIGDHAFFNCISLTHVKFHQGLKSIGRASFSACRWLREIDLPVGLMRIGNSAFCECKSLRSISIPGTLEVIEDGAFQYCNALAHVNIQEGLKSIEVAAFAGCSTLSAISLPSSLENLAFGAFLDCNSLVGVEFPSDFSARFGKDCFAHCNSLVTVSLPASVTDSPTKVFAGCELLQMHQTRHLRDRFKYFPLHKICYNASVTTVYDLILAFDTFDSKEFRDKLGMTPFHIVATSAHPRVEMLRCLLDKYPIETLECKDNSGKLMLDYLMMHSSSNALPLVKMVLQRAFVDQLSSWGLGEKWVSSLLECLELLNSDYDIEARCRYLHDSFFGDVGHCIRLEATSLMELALWKIRIKAVQKEEADSNNDNRQICRFHCGAGVAIGNVTEYLWHNVTKPNTALAVFQKIAPSVI